MSAAIAGDHIYVIGGWALKGEETDWHGTAWKLNLADPNAAWQPLAKPPFKRRALFATTHNGKIHVIGGMNSDGGPTTRTDVYDPESDSWSQGANLQGKPLTGFGSAAHALGGYLYVSTIDGSVQRLNEAEKKWDVVSEYEPARFFHVMVPWTETKNAACRRRKHVCWQVYRLGRSGNLKRIAVLPRKWIVATQVINQGSSRFDSSPPRLMSSIRAMLRSLLTTR